MVSEPPAFPDYEQAVGTYHSRVEECLDQTLANLGTDYLDLYLVHWPVPLNPKGNHPIFPLLPDGKRDVDHSWDLKDTWKQMEAMVQKGEIAGKVKSIGVSNFSQKKLDEILPTAEIIPVVNQLVEYLRSKDIVPEAYSPLGSTGSPLLSDETVLDIAKKHSLQAADVLVGYLPRIVSNLSGAVNALTKLESGDIEVLDGLAAAGKQKRFITPPGVSISSTEIHINVDPCSPILAVDLGFDIGRVCYSGFGHESIVTSVPVSRVTVLQLVSIKCICFRCELSFAVVLVAHERVGGIVPGRGKRADNRQCLNVRCSFTGGIYIVLKGREPHVRM
ncbi:NADP-dependent oxidoreductase domain-containing protein [Salix suchowensis]|nr:NADP-dependent oxidoreductase domain-containing protein [Salix suchowensis]